MRPAAQHRNPLHSLQSPLRRPCIPGNWETALCRRKERSKSCSASRDAHGLKGQLNPSPRTARTETRCTNSTLGSDCPGCSQRRISSLDTHTHAVRCARESVLHTQNTLQNTLQNTQHSHCIGAPTDAELRSKHGAVEEPQMCSAKDQRGTFPSASTATSLITFSPPPSSLGKPPQRVIGVDSGHMQTSWWHVPCWDKLQRAGLAPIQHATTPIQNLSPLGSCQV